MKLQAMLFDADDNPNHIAVNLTIAEAAYIARLTGQQSGESASAIMPDGDKLNAEIYDCLTGNVFNRYWDGGVADFGKDR